MLRQTAIALLTTVALGCGAGTADGGSDAPVKASLQVIRQAPMTIQGDGFRAQESVRVSAAGRQWHSKAGARGSFVLRLSGANPCRVVRIVAVGASGSRATLRIIPAGACAQP
jgi:hypothetical protein